MEGKWLEERRGEKREGRGRIVIKGGEGEGKREREGKWSFLVMAIWRREKKETVEKGEEEGDKKREGRGEEGEG